MLAQTLLAAGVKQMIEEAGVFVCFFFFLSEKHGFKTFQKGEKGDPIF